MGRVVISHIDQVSVVDFPSIAGISCSGHIETRAVIADASRPLLLWKHDLKSATELEINEPTVDHGFFVFDGNVEFDDQIVEKGGFISAEHLGRTTIYAGDEGASLLHFHRPDDHVIKPERAGGHIHMVDWRGILPVQYPHHGSTGVLLTDPNCQTCELWLHRVDYDRALPQKGSRHYHTSDEIIFILGGAMVIGNRTLKAGTALGIDANTHYGFGVSEGGLSFLNFRPGHSYYVKLEPEPSAPLDEKENWLTAMPL
jgi:hypothetical protein